MRTGCTAAELTYPSSILAARQLISSLCVGHAAAFYPLIIVESHKRKKKIIAVAVQMLAYISCNCENCSLHVNTIKLCCLIT